MGLSPSSVRSRRRSAGQWHALASLQREIQATDPNGRRKYLRDFSKAFRDYESVLTLAQLEAELGKTDIVLIGDYHALPASQRFASQILERLAQGGRRVVLGLETVFARDQHILEEWMRDEIDDEELRERIRFDAEWGYDWEPVCDLLRKAKQHAVAVYGLDCMPRDDLRKIGTRDRHAAQKIAQIHREHADAIMLVLFGESHLAPNHIPEILHIAVPSARVLTVLQNIDRLYWLAAGERKENVEAVRVNADVFCVFDATPLEKYESYRQCIERWRQENECTLDLAPTFYNLVDALARFLHIDKYAAQNGTQPVYLVDRMPEISSRVSEEGLRKLLRRKGAGEEEIKQILARIENGGCCYVARTNTIFLREFQMAGGAEEAARFIHQACRPGLPPAEIESVQSEEVREDIFYARVLEHALAYFGSRVLCPSRPAARESDLYALYAQPREAIEGETVYSYREYMQMLDFLVLHKDFESNPRQYTAVPELIRDGASFTGEKFAFTTEKLGYMLGSELYDGYLAGRVSKRYIRSLFFRKMNTPGAARDTYLQIVRKTRSPRRKFLD